MAKAKKKTKKSNGKALTDPFYASNEQAVGLHTFVIPAPRWDSPEQALDYLAGPFVEWVMVAEDLANIGALHEPLLLADLWCIARSLADYLMNPRPMESGDEAGGFVESLGMCLAGVHESIEKNDGLEYDGARGAAAISYATPKLLSDALRNAIKAQASA